MSKFVVFYAGAGKLASGDTDTWDDGTTARKDAAWQVYVAIN